MITKITLNNFKSHINTQITPARINIFLGPNMSGKTNIFRALLYLKKFVIPQYTAKIGYLFSYTPLNNFKEFLHFDGKGNFSESSEISIEGVFPGQLFQQILPLSKQCQFITSLKMSQDFLIYTTSVRDDVAPIEWCLELQNDFRLSEKGVDSVSNYLNTLYNDQGRITLELKKYPLFQQYSSWNPPSLNMQEISLIKHNLQDYDSGGYY